MTLKFFFPILFNFEKINHNEIISRYYPQHYYMIFCKNHKNCISGVHYHNGYLSGRIAPDEYTIHFCEKCLEEGVDQFDGCLDYKWIETNLNKNVCADDADIQAWINLCKCKDPNVKKGDDGCIIIKGGKRN